MHEKLPFPCYKYSRNHNIAKRLHRLFASAFNNVNLANLQRHSYASGNHNDVTRLIYVEVYFSKLIYVARRWKIVNRTNHEEFRLVTRLAYRANLTH